MKVYIGPYKNWFGPYQLAEKLCFWAKKEKDEFGFEREPDWVHNFGHWLATGSWDDEKSDPFNRKKEHKTLLYKFLLWIDKFKKRRMYIKIDRYDTWSMDSTLAPIILPMLKQLKATKHGSPIVDDEDVPEKFHTSYDSHNYDQLDLFPEKKDAVDEAANDLIHVRWNWVLNEMIFAFECLVDNSWEDKYSSGVMDHYSEPSAWDENGKPTLYQLKEGPNHTYKCDYDGLQKEQKRIDNGLRLFGKYYRGLWD